MKDIYHHDALIARNELFEIMDDLKGVLCEGVIKKIDKLITETDHLLDAYANA